MFRPFHGRRYSMLAACSANEGFLVPACDFGAGTFDVTNDVCITAALFEQWFEGHIVPILGSYTRGEPHSIIVMDNASVHDMHALRTILRRHGKDVVILPLSTYSPDYNPIEFAFSKFKASLMARIHNSRAADFPALWRACLRDVTPGDVAGWAREAGYGGMPAPGAAGDEVAVAVAAAMSSFCDATASVVAVLVAVYASSAAEAAAV